MSWNRASDENSHVNRKIGDVNGQLTFLSGFAISGNILQNGFITSRNFTEKRTNITLNQAFITENQLYTIYSHEMVRYVSVVDREFYVKYDGYSLPILNNGIELS